MFNISKESGKIEEDRGRTYFVDNDFFNSRYLCNVNLKYYCIKEREVSDFSIYSEEETIAKKNYLFSKL